MVRRSRVEVGVLVLLLSVASAGMAADHRAVVSGVVRDGAGVPQMGALVQVLSADSTVRATVFTNLQGQYLVQRLVPGVYGVRASAALYLPASRENLRLQPDHRAVVNLTLSGLFTPSSWLPARPRAADESRDDWNWTLRSSASRPILKWAEDGTSVAASSSEGTAHPRAAPVRATLQAPSNSFGGGSARFSTQGERVRSEKSRISLSTSVGATPTRAEAGTPIRVATSVERRSGPAGLVATKLSYESHPEISLASGGAGLKVLTISSASSFSVGGFADVEAGNSLEAVSGPVTTVVTRPFLRVSSPQNAWLSIAYSLATSPDTQDYESAIWHDADLPAAAYLDGRAQTEAGLHQEIMLSHRTKATRVAVGYYADSIDRVALSGGGGEIETAPAATLDGLPESGILLDSSNGSFQALDHGYRNSGWNILVTRSVGKNTWVAVQYSTGMALAVANSPNVSAKSGLPPLQARRSQAATISAKASTARTGTKVRASYRWQPDTRVTSVDPYDVLGGGNFLSFDLRQPVRLAGLPEGIELTVAGNNVLGQGYQHISGRAGSTAYLASSLSALQAGLAFNF